MLQQGIEKSPSFSGKWNVLIQKLVKRGIFMLESK
jgi:hypothetical protein